MERIIRMLARRLMRQGLNAGINRATRGAKAPQEMSQAERRQAHQARQAAKRARQAARMMRRMR